MKHLKHTVTAAALMAALAMGMFVANGATGGDDYSFAPPRGWARSSQPGPFLAVWRIGAGSADPQFIGVARFRFGASEAQFRSVSLKPYVERLFRNVAVGVEAASATCGGHFARYMAARYVNDSGNAAMVQEMISVWGGQMWIVAYGRRDGQPSRADGRTALTSLCVVGGSAPTRRSGTPAPSGSRTPTPAAPASQPPGLVSTSAPTGGYSTPYPTYHPNSTPPVLYSPPVNAPPTGH